MCRVSSDQLAAGRDYGASVSAIDLTLVGDCDERRRRVRLSARTTKTRNAHCGSNCGKPGQRRCSHAARGEPRTLRSRCYVAASIENLDAMLDLLSRQLDTELRIGHIDRSTSRIDAASLRPATLARIRRMTEQVSILYERVRSARTVGWGSGLDAVGCTRSSDGSRASHGG